MCEIFERVIAAAVSYAESYQHLPESAYVVRDMSPTTEHAVVMPIGLFWGLWARHKRRHGIEKPKKTRTIDDMIPPGI